jgi:hypothetical protein
MSHSWSSNLWLGLGKQTLSSKSVIAMMAIASIAPGIVHLTLANPPRFQASSVFGQGASPTGIFFGVLGIFQLVWWAVVALRPKNKPLVLFGILVYSLSIVIYFVATATPLPFGVPQLRLNQFPILTKVLELIFIAGSVGILSGEK